MIYQLENSGKRMHAYYNPLCICMFYIILSSTFTCYQYILSVICTGLRTYPHPLCKQQSEEHDVAAACFYHSKSQFIVMSKCSPMFVPSAYIIPHRSSSHEIAALVVKALNAVMHVIGLQLSLVLLSQHMVRNDGSCSLVHRYHTAALGPIKIFFCFNIDYIVHQGILRIRVYCIGKYLFLRKQLSCSFFFRRKDWLFRYVVQINTCCRDYLEHVFHFYITMFTPFSGNQLL